MVSDKEKAAVEKEARDILKKFGESLDKIKADFEEEVSEETRAEEDTEEADKEFRERMFDNAPKKAGDFFISEKAKW